MSVRVTLNCQVKPGHFKSLLPFLEENLPTVRGFHGNMRVEVLFDEKNSEMLIDEEWASVEDHKAYIGFISKNGILDSLGRFLFAPPEIKYFKSVDI
ncbi:MAG: antibiotic biosynthesis monooxygenase [Candidatus Thiodiazotropha sp.]|jgi:quinol monooxygenase YgiN